MNGNLRKAVCALGTLLLTGGCFSILALPAQAAEYTYVTVASSTIDLVFFPSINANGSVAFSGFSECQKGFVCPTIYTNYPSGAVQAIFTGTPSKVGTIPPENFSNVTINDTGAIDFALGGTNDYGSHAMEHWQNGEVKQLGEPQGEYGSPRILSNGSALFRDDTNHSRLFVATLTGKIKSETPQYCGSVFSGNSSLNGNFTFLGALALSADGCGEDKGLYIGNVHTGLTQLKLPVNSPYGQIISTAVNSEQQIAFSTLSIPGRSTNVNGLFLMDAGGKVEELAEIDNGTCDQTPPADGSACEYRSYGPLAINSKGQVVTSVTITDWAQHAKQSTHFMVALNGDLQNARVAGPMIGDCNLGYIPIGDRAINDLGQIVLWTYCVDPVTHAHDRTDVVVATPIPEQKN